MKPRKDGDFHGRAVSLPEGSACVFLGREMGARLFSGKSRSRLVKYLS